MADPLRAELHALATGRLLDRVAALEQSKPDQSGGPDLLPQVVQALASQARMLEERLEHLTLRLADTQLRLLALEARPSPPATHGALGKLRRRLTGED